MEWQESEALAVAREVVRRQRLYWQILIFLPLAYMIACVAIRRLWFEPHELEGLLPLRGNARLALIGGFIGAAAVGEALVLFLRRRLDRAIHASPLAPEAMVSLLTRRFFLLGAICDSVAFAGFVLFLFLGDLRLMALFAVAGLLLFIQVYPRDGLVQGIGQPEERDGDGRRPQG